MPTRNGLVLILAFAAFAVQAVVPLCLRPNVHVSRNRMCAPSTVTLFAPTGVQWLCQSAGQEQRGNLCLRGGSDENDGDNESDLRASEEERLRREADELLQDGEGAAEFETQMEHGLIEAAEAEDADPDRWRELADFLQSKGRDLQYARELYERCLERDRGNLRANCNFGRLLHEAGEHDAAEEHYMRALKTDPDDTDTLSYYGVFLQSVRKVLPAAAAIYRRVLEQRPDDADCHSNYGTLLLEMLGPTGSLDAEEHLKKALALQPDNLNALYNYAVLLQELRGDWKEASNCLEKVLELDPGDMAATYNYAIMQLEVEGNYDKAEELCLKVLDAQPDDVDALYVYGDLLAFKRPEGQRDYANARRVYERVLELEPDHIDVMINCGILLMQGYRDLRGALGIFLRAAQLDPHQVQGGRSEAKAICERIHSARARWVAKGLEGAYHHDTIAKRYEDYKKSEELGKLARRYEEYKSGETQCSEEEEDGSVELEIHSEVEQGAGGMPV